jgi:UDP-glucuronate 4-epimerase
MKVLVTGASGFIGFHLASALLERGDEVVGLDNMSGKNMDLQQARLCESGIPAEQSPYGSMVTSRKYNNYRFIRLDITDGGKLEELFSHECFDRVCHLAAKTGVRRSLAYPGEYIRSNVGGFANILETCRRHQVQHLLYASSSSVYGANQAQPYAVGQLTDNPISMYAATKKMNELMAYTYSHLYRLPTTGLRFFTVYGPWGRSDMAPFLFTKAIAEEKPVKVYNNGNMFRDFTYVDDIVRSILLLLDDDVLAEQSCQLYNIGRGCPVALLDFIAMIEKYLGKIAIKQLLPLQKGDMISTFANVSPLEKRINYKPNTSVEEGLEKFIVWYKDFYNIK